MNIQELLKADRIAEDDVLAAAETIVTARRHRKLKLQEAQDVGRHIRANAYCHDRECFYVLTMDQKNRLIKMHLVSIGTLTEALVHPREVFRPAIADNAAAIIIAHNHPSGDAHPSHEDQVLTTTLQASANLLGIRFTDHVIVGDGEQYSFAEAELL